MKHQTLSKHIKHYRYLQTNLRIATRLNSALGIEEAIHDLKQFMKYYKIKGLKARKGGAKI